MPQTEMEPEQILVEDPELIAMMDALVHEEIAARLMADVLAEKILEISQNISTQKKALWAKAKDLYGLDFVHYKYVYEANETPRVIRRKNSPS